MHFFPVKFFFRCFAIIPYIKVVFEEVKFIQKSATKTNKHYLQSVALAWSKVKTSYEFFKVHIFWEGHKILRNLHQLFVLCTASQIIGGYFAKFFGLLRVYEI